VARAVGQFLAADVVAMVAGAAGTRLDVAGLATAGVAAAVAAAARGAGDALGADAPDADAAGLGAGTAAEVLGAAVVAGLGAGAAAAEARGAAGLGVAALGAAGLGVGAAADALAAVVRAPAQGPETFAVFRIPPGRGAIIAASNSPATTRAANQPIHEARGRSGGASQCLR